MRWLNRLLDEDGAVIVLVAIAIVAILGIAGLVFDVGTVYGTRAELSRGADAVALAVAQECASNPSACSTEAQGALAQYYASANLDHGAATLHGFEVNADERWVEVVTESFRDASFMRVLGFTGTTVRARAIATWGHPRTAIVGPFAFNDCVYELYPLLDPAVEGDPRRSVEFTINLTDIDEDDCAGLPAGSFGHLDIDSMHDCSTEATIGEPKQVNTGNTPSCTASAMQEQIYEQTMLVAVYDATSGQGNFAEYHINAIAAFYTTGYYFAGQYRQPSGQQPLCTGNERCIRGYFVEKVGFEGTTGGPDRGVSIVKLVE